MLQRDQIRINMKWDAPVDVYNWSHSWRKSTKLLLSPSLKNGLGDGVVVQCRIRRAVAYASFACSSIMLILVWDPCSQRPVSKYITYIEKTLNNIRIEFGSTYYVWTLFNMQYYECYFFGNRILRAEGRQAIGWNRTRERERKREAKEGVRQCNPTPHQ